MNYYEHHIGDFDSATAHLSLLEDAVYRRLICLYYRSEAPIPADIKQACRLVRASSKAERDTVVDVLGEFFTLADDGWHNARCDEEIARFKDKQRKARASADARWSKSSSHTERNANASPNVMRTHSEGNADGMHRAPVPSLQTPDTRVIPPNPPSGGDDPPGFDEFWASWPSSPRKQDRKKCADKWRRKHFGQQLAAIVAHVEAMKQSKQWRDGFEPAPLTYLNGERWGDGLPSEVEASDTEGFI